MDTCPVDPSKPTYSPKSLLHDEQIAHLQAGRSRVQELAARYNELRAEILKLRGEKVAVFKELQEVNADVAWTLGRLGVPALEYVGTSEEEVLYALVQMTKERYQKLMKEGFPVEWESDAKGRRLSPRQRKPTVSELFVQAMLRGPSTADVVKHILESRGLGAFEFDEPSVERFFAAVEEMLNTLQTAGRVRWFSSPSSRRRCWLLLSFAGAEVVDARFVATFAHAQQELAGLAAEDERLPSIQRIDLPEDWEVRCLEDEAPVT